MSASSLKCPKCGNYRTWKENGKCHCADCKNQWDLKDENEKQQVTKVYEVPTNQQNYTKYIKK